MAVKLKPESKLPYVVITAGLTFLVAGLVFFMISAGLPHLTWLVLGGVCLALGALLLGLGVLCCLYLLKSLTGRVGGWNTQRQKDEAVAFTVETSDDSCVI